MNIHGLSHNMPPAAIDLPPDNFQQLCEYASSAEAEPELLSPTESRIVELQSGGMTVVDIAATLGYTSRNQPASILQHKIDRQLGTRNANGRAYKALYHELIRPDEWPYTHGPELRPDEQLYLYASAVTGLPAGEVHQLLTPPPAPVAYTEFDRTRKSLFGQLDVHTMHHAITRAFAAGVFLTKSACAKQ